MHIKIVNPLNGLIMQDCGTHYTDPVGNTFLVKNGVARICDSDNYSYTFGYQWQKFNTTQLDNKRAGLDQSSKRLFAETGWSSSSLREDQTILEVGSGAGRFTQVILNESEAKLYSVDYSDAIEVNYLNNHAIASNRSKFFQSSIYQLPFEPESFDQVICLGVLQHTPDVELSIKALAEKVAVGGQLTVDFYPIRGWWTKLNAKYLLRPLLTRLSSERLLALINKNVDWLIILHMFFHRTGLGMLNRFLPLCNIAGTFPTQLTATQRREWAVLDTFDMYSPKYDSPQRLTDVVNWFAKYGLTVTFAGDIFYGTKCSATVVRGTK
jgi:2-polyprenyl-3-methyl-5-hydroxy-6-metoxy-1,4-benzoquinol methylase